MLSKKYKSGFTVVEIIVTVVVIGILLGVGGYVYSSYFQRSDKAAANATLQKVKIKLNQYYRDKNNFPASSSEVSSYLTSSGDSSLRTEFDTIISAGGTYLAAPASCDNAPGNKCESYTVTVPTSYWGGSGSPLTIES